MTKQCDNMFKYTYEESAYVWLTADHHFGHENIIKYSNRPFDSVDTMDRILIDRWNKVVGYSDTVFHLGDFTLNNEDTAYKILSQLNGFMRICELDWHHDYRWNHIFYTNDINRLPCTGIKENGGGRLVKPIPPEFVIEIEDCFVGKYPLSFHCSHYPLGEWDRKHYDYPHLHGHSHGNYSGDDWNCIDVGVDRWDYYPVNLQNLIDMYYGDR